MLIKKTITKIEHFAQFVKHFVDEQTYSRGFFCWGEKMYLHTWRIVEFS